MHYESQVKKARTYRAPRGQTLHPSRRQGRIKESDDVGRSLSQDRRRKAKTVAKPGQGDRGDRNVTRAKITNRTATRALSYGPERPCLRGFLTQIKGSQGGQNEPR